MVILHYIPSLSKTTGNTPKLVEELSAAMNRTMTSHIFIGNVTKRYFLKKIQEVNPDILHIHGCWNIQLALAEYWAISHNIAVVISPHGQLSDDYMETDFWKSRLPRIFAYQFLAIRKAFVLHASTSAELASLKDLGWKRRIALIPVLDENSRLNISDDVIKQFKSLYQKVIDTCRINYLSPEETECLWKLLRLSATPENEVDSSLTEDLCRVTSMMTEQNWTNIQIFALDHRISDILYSALRCAKVSLPSVVKSVPERYKTKSDLRFTSDRLFDEPELKVSETGLSSAESNTAEIINSILQLRCYLQKLLAHEDWAPPIVLLSRLYGLLRFTDYDEDVIQKELGRQKANVFASRLMQVLSDRFGLTVGFMPFNPIKDKKTNSIEQRLNTLFFVM